MRRRIFGDLLSQVMDHHQLLHFEHVLLLQSKWSDTKITIKMKHFRKLLPSEKEEEGSSITGAKYGEYDELGSSGPAAYEEFPEARFAGGGLSLWDPSVSG